MRYRQLIFLLALPAPLLAQTSPPTEDPFAGFETVYLENGLKVWYKRLAGVPLASISVAVPYGSDMDPPGKEQLAHFTEHMMFADQPGRSEDQIRQEIEDLGGVYNASVTSDRTFYYVRVGSESACFAIEWLSRILGPHAMDPAVVERQREPVALEIRARRRQLFDWIWALYLYPPALRPPGFWESEFGLKTWLSRDYYPYASLHSITPEDLREFYDTYYAPSQLTLTVVGDVDRDSAIATAARTFGALPERPAPQVSRPLVDPDRYWQQIIWDYRSNVYYSNRYKFYDLAPDREVMLLFMARWLSKRLNDRLRFGERKAAYGVSVSVVKRAGASYLQVSGGFKKDEFDYARGVVDEEVASLRSGSMSADHFETVRSALVRQLQVNENSPEDLESWVSRYFYHPRAHVNFPDLVATFASYNLEDVQRFVQAGFVPEHQYVTILRPHFISQGFMLVAIVAIIWLSVYAVRRALLQPADMTRIRYVARFKLPGLYLLALLLLTLVLTALGARLLAFGFQLLIDRFLVRLDSFSLQYLSYALMLAAAVMLLVILLGNIPRKLLVFEDELRLKYLSYRSYRIRFDSLEDVSLRRFREVWLSRRLWRCTPLAVGLLSPAIYLRRRGGRAIYFRTRDTGEALALLRAARARLRSQESSGQAGSGPGEHRPY